MSAMNASLSLYPLNKNVISTKYFLFFSGYSLVGLWSKSETRVYRGSYRSRQEKSGFTDVLRVLQPPCRMCREADASSKVDRPLVSE